MGKYTSLWPTDAKCRAFRESMSQHQQSLEPCGGAVPRGPWAPAQEPLHGLRGALDRRQPGLFFPSPPTVPAAPHASSRVALDLAGSQPYRWQRCPENTRGLGSMVCGLGGLPRQPVLYKLTAPEMQTPGSPGANWPSRWWFFFSRNYFSWHTCNIQRKKNPLLF